MNRITWNESDGSWGIKGAKLETLPPKVYGALYKLMNYEKTGLSPKQIEEMDLLYTEKCKEVAKIEKKLEKLYLNQCVLTYNCVLLGIF